VYVQYRGGFLCCAMHYNSLPRDAMHSADYAVARCLSVTITRRYSIEAAVYHQTFSPSSSHTILVFFAVANATAIFATQSSSSFSVALTYIYLLVGIDQKVMVKLTHTGTIIEKVTMRRKNHDVLMRYRQMLRQN